MGLNCIWLVFHHLSRLWEADPDGITGTMTADNVETHLLLTAGMAQHHGGSYSK